NNLSTFQGTSSITCSYRRSIQPIPIFWDLYNQTTTRYMGVNGHFLPWLMTNNEVEMLDKIEVLFTEDQIQKRVAALGATITADYSNRSVVLISVLRGSIFFATDLARHVLLPVAMDFLSISSYGEGSEGAVRITKDLEENIAGKDVLLVEDIVDT